ncbi:MAG: flagellar protein FliS [Balneolaceae bacterium]|nr:MAG: flagellar protein FliS [Balneolaceae bacterium]
MRNPQLAYQKQSVNHASPLQLVVKLYDLVIQASYREDSEKVKDLLSGLIHGLNFEHEPADQLFAIYHYCQDLARKGEFGQIREILEPLRETWEEVAKQVPVHV